MTTPVNRHPGGWPEGMPRRGPSGPAGQARAVDPETERLRLQLTEAQASRVVLAEELARCRGGSESRLADRLARAGERNVQLIVELEVARAELHATRAELRAEREKFAALKRACDEVIRERDDWRALARAATRPTKPRRLRWRNTPEEGTR